MTLPDNWHRPHGAATSGPAVVFDLDGVISDATHRQPYLRQQPQDWRGFFAAGIDDPVIESGRALAGSVGQGHAVIILTARPSYMASGTVDWLERNDVRHDLLVVRPAADRRSSPEYKHDELVEMGSAGYDVQLAIDDDQEIVDMYRRQDVFALYVHSGYYVYRDAQPHP